MRSYQLVQERNLAGLKEYLIDHCIDEWLPGSYFYSATSKFAEEGDFQSVEIMLNQGAFINYAAVGAGCGGHQAYAERLIVRGANINYVARGAAWRGHVEYVEQLIARGAKKDEVAFGFGLGGWRSSLDMCFNETEIEDHYERYVRGLLLSGRRDLINRVVDAEKQNPKFRRAWFWLGVGLAFHEDNNLVKELTRGLPLVFFTDQFAYGAALGGHYNYLESFVQRGRVASMHDIIFAAALSGRSEIINKLLKKGKLVGSRHGFVRYLSDLVSNQRGISLGAFAGGHLMHLSQLAANKRFDISKYLAAEIRPAIVDNHVSVDQPRSIMLLLSPFPIKMVPTLAAGLFSEDEFKDAAAPDKYIQHLRAISVARQKGMTFEFARIATEKNEHGQLLNQAALMVAISAFVAGSNQTPHMGLFKDIWKIILNYVFNENFTKSEWETFTLILTKTLMTTVLDDYSRFFNFGRNKKRAESFSAAVKEVNTASELRKLVIEQKQLVIDGKREASGKAAHERPLRHGKTDQYHSIISLWAKRLTPSSLVTIAKSTRHDAELLAHENDAIEQQEVRRSEPPISSASRK